MVAKLVKILLAALESSGMQPKDMQRLIRVLTWPALLKRCLLSVFDSVYDLASAPRPLTPLCLTNVQQNELQQVLAFLPLVFADWILPVS